MDASSPEMLRLAAMIRNTVVRVTGAIDEDLVQDVWVALLPLIPTWDSTRNDSLAGFLSSRCRGAVIGALRKRNAIEALCTWHRDTGRAARRPVVHVQVGMFGRNHLRDDGRRRGITWQWEIDRALTVADGTEVDDRDELVRAARSLTPRQKAALWAEFVAEEDQQTQADRFGCTASRISQIVAEARNKARRA